MVEFFSGWRRKAGVVTLLMACIFMAGWLRSNVLQDNFAFYSGIHSDDALLSADNSLGWYRHSSPDSIVSPFMPYWRTWPFTEIDNVFHDPALSRSWRFCGFASAEFERQGIKVWIIPYWSIVIPLTLLAAYLLLSKPNKSTSKKITKPAATDTEGGVNHE